MTRRLPDKIDQDVVDTMEEQVSFPLDTVQEGLSPLGGQAAKRPRVLLINPTIDIARVRGDWALGASQPPQGLAALAGYLKLHGHDTEILDMLVEPYGPGDLVRRIQGFGPDVVGISTYTQPFETCRAICRFIKRRFPHIVTILGGPHATALPKETLESEPAADFVVGGEGESTLLELLEHIRYPGAVNLEQIDGLAYRENGGIIVNKPRKKIQCLDILPFPDREGMSLDRYAAAYTLISSRGCPGECIFCAAGALSGSQQRMRSAENVFSEVYFLARIHHARFLTIADDSFTVSHRRVKRFCSLVVATGLEIHWRCESRVQGMTREVLACMADAGCVCVQFGVESGSQIVLDRIRKHLSLDKLPFVLQAAREVGISPICMFMFGHYCDTSETMQQTIDLARYLRERYQAGILFASNTPFPGTYQYIYRDELGLHLYSEAWENFSPEVNNLHNVYTEHFDRDMLARFYFDAQELAMTREEANRFFSHRTGKQASV